MSPEKFIRWLENASAEEVRATLPTPTVPLEWLRVRLLPTDLIAADELFPCFQIWRNGLEADREHRGSNQISNLYFDVNSGRASHVSSREETDPLNSLFYDLDEFCGLAGVDALQSLGARDEVWRFCSDPTDWESLAGRSGFTVVQRRFFRRRRVRTVFLTAMS